MSDLLLNEIFLSIFSRDDYYSLAYYSFNNEGLFFKDKFSDNTLNFENVLAFVRQLRPTFCVLNYGVKNELYYLLVDTLNELFFIDRIDDEEDETSSKQSLTTPDQRFTSIRNVNLMNQVEMINNLVSPNSRMRTNDANNNQVINQINLNENQGSLQNQAITTTADNKSSRVLLLTKKFYNIDLCKNAIFECNFHQGNIFTENDKRVFITSLVDLSDDFLLKSIGALIIYINQNKLNANNHGKGLSIRKFERFRCQNYVNIDQVTLNELNVFSYKDHPSIFKKDALRKDDSSLFSLFNKCKSSYGTNYLRKLFFQPMNCYERLNNRLDDIEQIIELSKDVLYFHYSCLKKIKSINAIVEKMKIMTLNYKQFLLLATTVDNLISIHQYVLTHSVDLKIYRKIKEYYPKELEQIIGDMKVVINLEKSAEGQKIEINQDVNEELDKMKSEFENIEQILSIATNYEKDSKLIDYIPNFQIIFSPIFGFVIQVFHKDLLNEKKMLLSLRDIEYISTTDKFKYFKTNNLKKYDESYSNLMMEISCKQNAILLDLQGGILNRLPKVFKFLDVIGEFDCLLRFAQVAKLYNYVRPSFNFQNIIDIKNGRHPLKEAVDASQFVPNDYHSELPKSIKIITGANNSGKTVYLKQNCLIVFMAYLGSFVPADSCNLPLFSKILTKIETIESMSTGLSSFTNDLCRLSNIISKIPYNSLVVVDEFGKGTNFEDGLSIFSAYINHLIDENPKSHFIISTHIHSLPDFLERNSSLTYQKMEIKFENDEIFYTYKLIDGFAEFSFPLELGKKIKFDPLILKRANHIRELHKNGGSFKEMAAYSTSELDKVNKIFNQIAIIRHMVNSVETDNVGSQDVEMKHDSDVEDEEMD